MSGQNKLTKTCAQCGAVLVLSQLDSDYPVCLECGQELTTTDIAGSETDSLSIHNTKTETPPNLEGFRFIRRVGQGGMGDVWLAEQISLGNRIVAVKLLPEKLLRNQKLLNRFEQEARALAHFSHAHIATVYDYRSNPAGQHFIIMEFVGNRDGSTTDLSYLISNRGLTCDRSKILMIQILDALDYAHEHKVIHRDVKPSNVMLDFAGRAKLVDFGIAACRFSADQELTVGSGPMGTADYMAPEQAKDARHVDERADIYSAGVVLYEMLTGTRPKGMFAMPSNLIEGISTNWDKIVMRALQPDPEQRFASANEMRAAIERVDIDNPGNSPTSVYPVNNSIQDNSCYSCRTPVAMDAQFCPECGTKLRLECPRCDAIIEGGAKFCPGCGNEYLKMVQYESHLQEARSSLNTANDKTISLAERFAAAELAGILLTMSIRLFPDESGPQALRNESNRLAIDLARLAAKQAIEQNDIVKAREYIEFVKDLGELPRDLKQISLELDTREKKKQLAVFCDSLRLLQDSNSYCKIRELMQDRVKQGLPLPRGGEILLNRLEERIKRSEEQLQAIQSVIDEIYADQDSIRNARQLAYNLRSQISDLPGVDDLIIRADEKLNKEKSIHKEYFSSIGWLLPIGACLLAVGAIVWMESDRFPFSHRPVNTTSALNFAQTRQLLVDAMTAYDLGEFDTAWTTYDNLQTRINCEHKQGPLSDDWSDLKNETESWSQPLRNMKAKAEATNILDQAERELQGKDRAAANQLLEEAEKWLGIAGMGQLPVLEHRLDQLKRLPISTELDEARKALSNATSATRNGDLILALDELNIAKPHLKKKLQTAEPLDQDWQQLQSDLADLENQVITSLVNISISQANAALANNETTEMRKAIEDANEWINEARKAFIDVSDSNNMIADLEIKYEIQILLDSANAALAAMQIEKAKRVLKEASKMDPHATQRVRIENMEKLLSNTIVNNVEIKHADAIPDDISVHVVNSSHLFSDNKVIASHSRFNIAGEHNSIRIESGLKKQIIHLSIKDPPQNVTLKADLVKPSCLQMEKIHQIVSDTVISTDGAIAFSVEKMWPNKGLLLRWNLGNKLQNYPIRMENSIVLYPQCVALSKDSSRMAFFQRVAQPAANRQVTNINTVNVRERRILSDGGEEVNEMKLLIRGSNPEVQMIMFGENRNDHFAVCVRDSVNGNYRYGILHAIIGDGIQSYDLNKNLIESISAFAYSQDGTHIYYSHGENNPVVKKVTTTEKGVVSGVQYYGHKNSVVALRTTSDGKRLVGVSARSSRNTRAFRNNGNDMVIVWDIHTGKELWKTQIMPRQGKWHACCAAITPDGGYAIVGFQDGYLQIYDIVGGIGLVWEQSPTVTSSEMNSISISDSGRHAFSGHKDGNVYYWTLPLSIELH